MNEVGAGDGHRLERTPPVDALGAPENLTAAGEPIDGCWMVTSENVEIAALLRSRGR